MSDISPDSVVCACSHLSDFMVFVRGSYEPLLSSNYHALSSLKLLTPSHLWNNTGFKLSFVLTAVFLILLLLSSATQSSLSSD